MRAYFTFLFFPFVFLLDSSSSSLHLFVISFHFSGLEVLLLCLCGLLTHLSACVLWHILSTSVNLSFFLDQTYILNNCYGPSEPTLRKKQEEGNLGLFMSLLTSPFPLEQALSGTYWLSLGVTSHERKDPQRKTTLMMKTWWCVIQ